MNTNKNNRRKNKKQSARDFTKDAYHREITKALGRPIPAFTGPLQQWIPIKLQYSELLTLTISGGSSSDYSFNMNSLFDPNRTGTGHQPRGFDQLTPLYNRYCIDRCTWDIEIPSIVNTMNYAVVPANGITIITDVSDAAERRFSNQRAVGAGAPSAVFRGSCNLPNFLGRSLFSYHTDDLTAAIVSASPNEVLELHIVATNPGIVSATVTYIVKLTYRGIMRDFIVPVPS